jgi:hypothetical protein
MEIKSNMKKSYLKNYNEAKGIAVNKKRVLKHKTNKVPTYLTSALITITLLSLCTILFSIIDSSKIFKMYFLISLIIYVSYSIIRTIASIQLKRNQIDLINTITIDEEGITDKSFFKIKINVSWDKITAVVVKKHTVTFITDTQLFFFFDIKDKEDILKLVKKYSKNTLIIE